jgi:hypothetical protein
MLESINKLRLPQSQIVQGFGKRHQVNFVRLPAFANANRTGSNNGSEFAFEGNEATPEKQTAVSGKSRHRRPKCDYRFRRLRPRQILEGEIQTASYHAKVVFCAVYHIPAEIIDPANMRRDADFDATTELANQLCLGITLTSANSKRIEGTYEFGNLLYNKMCLFSATKMPPPPAKT